MIIRLFVISLAILIGYLIGQNGAFTDGYDTSNKLSTEYCNKQMELLVNQLKECQE